MREVSFHESDYCSIELLPADNWCHCLERMKSAVISPVYQVRRDRVGLDPRNDVPVPIATLQISRPEWFRVVGLVFPSFDCVLAAAVDQRVAHGGTMAFGPRENLVCFAQWNPQNIVHAAWFRLELATAEDVQLALRAFKTLRSRWDLILADWQRNVLIRLGDFRELATYLTHRKEPPVEPKVVPTKGHAA